MTTSRVTLPLLLLISLAAAPFIAAPRASAAESGVISVQVTLQADKAAAARTWRFEVVNLSGTVVETLSAGASGDRLNSTVTTGAIPHGFYTVRQVLTNDTKASCADGAFYEVTAPVSASTVVELAGPVLSVPFVIRPCAALPKDLNVQVPIDTIARPVGGVIDDASVLPRPAVVDEVRGVRSGGPAAPLAPNTGTSVAASRGARMSRILVSLGAVLASFSAAGMAVAVRRPHFKR